MSETSSTFIYVIYIRTTPEKLWDALTNPEFTRQYWLGTWQDCTWQKGASWKLMIPDGRVGDSGEVVEIDKPRKLVLRWRNEFLPDLRAEGYSLCTITLEPQGNMGVVKLTVTHTMDRPNSKFIQGVSTGWPGVFSGLKTLLETGKSFEGADRWPEGV